MMHFLSFSGKKFKINEIARELFEFMKELPNYHYNIVIGTDSEDHNLDYDEFVTAIVIHRVGRGGRYFWRKVHLKKNKTLRERIYEEVSLSIEVARKLINYLKKANDFNFSFEIHIDVGINGNTKTMVQEVIGMVKGFGFEVKTKPEAYGASNVADRYL
ncbi:ribonuclease H-like YkuK family protein [bacterium]|nr:ribonuclease H-like YkuK family protein [bacterium]